MVRAVKEMLKRQGKLKSLLKEFGRAFSTNKIHYHFTHHSLSTVTHCPAIGHFHINKITASFSIDYWFFYQYRL